MTSSQHAPYTLGYTRTTMVGTKGSKRAIASESHQTQPQFRLQAATRLHEGGMKVWLDHLLKGRPNREAKTDIYVSLSQVRPEVGLRNIKLVKSCQTNCVLVKDEDPRDRKEQGKTC